VRLIVYGEPLSRHPTTYFVAKQLLHRMPVCPALLGMLFFFIIGEPAIFATPEGRGFRARRSLWWVVSVC